MALFEGKTPAERNKTIAALVLGVIALFFIVRLFFGDSSRPATTSTQPGARPRPTPSRATARTTDTAAPDESLIPPQKVVYRPFAPAISGTGRNIFAFYVPPPPPPKPVVTPPPPTPTPPPPLLVTAIAPSNVFARTGDFALQVSGDKFTPQTRIYIDGQEVPTRFVSPQQLSANVPGSFINAPGGRQIIIRSPDGQLYSNSATLNVAQPPVPSYTFVGVLVRPRGNDTAILKDTKNELINVQRGDIVGGRFRVTSISARAVEFVDQQLKIKHTIPFSEARAGGAAPRVGSIQPQPPPPPKEDGDEEP